MTVGSATESVALDTSVAVPWLMESHPQHDRVRDAIRVRTPRLTGHSLAETYSVLTRFPGDARAEPAEAAEAIARAFGPPVILSDVASAQVVSRLAGHGIGGGAVYDGLVALAAIEARIPLVTRDLRAAGTYARLGVTVMMLPDEFATGSG